MSHINDLARESAKDLFSDIVSAERFKIWRKNSTTGILSSYVFGEIFWKKSLGGPDTPKLSDAFTVEAWHDQVILVGDIGGAAQWETVRAPNFPSWWDGKDDSEYWRVSYLVPNLPSGVSNDGLDEHSMYTHIVPHLKSGIRWKTPGGTPIFGSGGLRRLEPPDVVFVKKDESEHFSFEIVLRLIFVIP